jgi:cellulose synthase/poly-beta-1,6-N-acetylglucosamine synthase-like glycosyltransferase
LIIETLRLVIILYTGLTVCYLIRHYGFTFTVLRKTNNFQLDDFGHEFYEPTVSIIVPARDEENVIGRLLQRLSELTYPRGKLQVIVINDASTDATGQIAEKYSRQYEFIKVVHRDKKTGGKGKPAAINSCLHLLTGEIVIFFDADYTPQIGILEKLVRGFIDPKVGAVQGRPVVSNEPDNIVTRIVAMERTGGYCINQLARDILGLIPQFGGTVGGFRRTFLKEIGPLDESMLTEDTDLTFLACLHGYRIHYIDDAECYEEAVDSWSAYWRQRHRWALGHMQVCFKYSWSVIKSRNLCLKEKIDGLLLLHLYFMPVATLFSWLAGITLVLCEPSSSVYSIWYFAPVSFYILAANSAPFFEIGIGTFLDGRTRMQWLIPLLLFSYLFNILICTRALFDLLFSKITGNRNNTWAKTNHLGGEDHYFRTES